MALTSTEQADFGGGIHRSRNAPPNSVWDATDALINDAGQLFKRGAGSQFSTSDLGFTVDGMASTNLAVGPRFLVWGDGKLSYMDTGTGVLTAISTTRWPLAGQRIAVVDGIALWIYRTNPTSYLGWAGSAKASSYAVGTVTVTQNSETVVGVGSSWTANVDAGMILQVGTGSAVVKSVDSNTSLTLTRAWQAATSAGAGYTLSPMVEKSIAIGPSGAASFTVLAAAGLQNGLLIADGERIYIAERWHPFTFDKDVISNTTLSYLDMPRGEILIGMQGIGDTVLAFTTGGVWAILNTTLSVEDDFGNIQWQVRQINTQVVLWGDPGIALYAGGVIAPALDDVYVVGLDGSASPISAVQGPRGDWLEKIRPLYRSYVAAGYTPGRATVVRGHYILPIVTGSTLIDVLVCRLDRGAGWTRWTGYAAGLAYGVFVDPTTGRPSLFGAKAQRVTSLIGCFDPTALNPTDGDSTVPSMVITTRDYPTQQAHGFVQRARLRYELTDDGSGATAAPTVALAYSSDADAGSFSTLTDKGLQGGGTGGAVSAGDKYNWWTVGKRRERIRFKITFSGASASAILRSLEMLTRQSGRQ